MGLQNSRTGVDISKQLVKIVMNSSSCLVVCLAFHIPSDSIKLVDSSLKNAFHQNQHSTSGKHCCDIFGIQRGRW